MKRFLLLIFVSLFVLSQSYAGIIIRGTGGAAPTCTIYEQQNTGTSQINVGYDDNRWNVGEIYVAPANVDVCKVVFILEAVGDPAGSGYYYTAEIFTLDGSSNFNVSQGESASVNANNGWSGTLVEFDFTPSVSLTSGTSYAIVIHRDDGGSVDAVNYIRGYYTATDVAPFDHANEDFCRWGSAGNLASRFDGWDVRMQVYTDQ